MKKYKATIVIHLYENPTDEFKKEKQIEVVVEGETPEMAMEKLWIMVNNHKVPELTDKMHPGLYAFEITNEDEIKEAV